MGVIAAAGELLALLGGLELAPMLLALVAVAIVYVGRDSIAWLLRGIADNIPVVGGYIAGAIQSVLDATLTFATDALNGMLQPVSAIFAGAGASIAGLSLEVASFAGTMAGSMERLVSQWIPAFVGAVASEIVTLVGDVAGELNTVFKWAASAITTVQAEVAAVEHQVVDAIVPALDWTVSKAIPALGHAVSDVQSEIVQVLQPEIGALQNWDVAVAPIVQATALAVTDLTWFRYAENQACLKNTCARLPDILDLLDNAEGSDIMARILSKAHLTPAAALALLDSGFTHLVGSV